MTSRALGFSCHLFPRRLKFFAPRSSSSRHSWGLNPTSSSISSIVRGFKSRIALATIHLWVANGRSEFTGNLNLSAQTPWIALVPWKVCQTLVRPVQSHRVATLRTVSAIPDCRSSCTIHRRDTTERRILIRHEPNGHRLHKYQPTPNCLDAGNFRDQLSFVAPFVRL